MQKLVYTYNRPMNWLACILHYRKPTVYSLFQNINDGMRTHFDGESEQCCLQPCEQSSRNTVQCSVYHAITILPATARNTLKCCKIFSHFQIFPLYL